MTASVLAISTQHVISRSVAPAKACVDPQVIQLGNSCIDLASNTSEFEAGLKALQEIPVLNFEISCATLLMILRDDNHPEIKKARDFIISAALARDKYDSQQMRI